MLAYDWNFLGLSLEAKPMTGEKVVDGSTFYECDTCDFYIFYQNKWYKQTLVTEDGINVCLYKSLMKKMFGKLFDSNITKSKIIKPDTGTNIEFTTNLPAQIIDLTGYGDSTQQTYTGKNLMPMAISDNTTSRVNNFRISLPAGTYTISFDLSDIELGSNQSFNIIMTIAGAVSGGGNYDNNISGTISSTTATHMSFTFTTTADSNASANSNIRISQTYWDNGGRAKLSNIQIEAGSTATSYEPYVGGIPAPNPDYPQAVNVVTGTQTITISDGTNSQTYTVDLGSTELCKIGDYQDYIYKSGDNWYVHKAIGKYTFTGQENWLADTYGASSWRSDNILSNIYDYSEDKIVVISDVAKGIPYNRRSQADNPLTCVCYYLNTSHRFWLRNTVTLTTLAMVQAATANTNLYYLATPTDTKITGTTLINNLNSLLKYTFPAGVNNIIITADDLPMPLKLIISEKE